jgi:hypothetical protein
MRAIRANCIFPKSMITDKLGIDSSLDRNPWNVRLWAGRFGVKVLPGRGKWGKAPRTKIQAPGKHQVPIFKPLPISPHVNSRVNECHFVLWVFGFNKRGRTKVD